MDFIPERSELQVENLEIKDRVVRDMVRDIGLKKLIPGKKDRRAATTAEWTHSGTAALTSFISLRVGRKVGDLACWDWGKNNNQP